MASMARKLGGNQACGRVLGPSCPRFLMQELNAGTVHLNHLLWALVRKMVARES